MAAQRDGQGIATFLAQNIVCFVTLALNHLFVWYTLRDAAILLTPLTWIKERPPCTVWKFSFCSAQHTTTTHIQYLAFRDNDTAYTQYAHTYNTISPPILPTDHLSHLTPPLVILLDTAEMAEAWGMKALLDDEGFELEEDEQELRERSEQEQKEARGQEAKLQADRELGKALLGELARQDEEEANAGLTESEIFAKEMMARWKKSDAEKDDAPAPAIPSPGDAAEDDAASEMHPSDTESLFNDFQHTLASSPTAEAAEEDVSDHVSLWGENEHTPGSGLWESDSLFDEDYLYSATRKAVHVAENATTLPLPKPVGLALPPRSAAIVTPEPQAEVVEHTAEGRPEMPRPVQQEANKKAYSRARIPEQPLAYPGAQIPGTVAAQGKTLRAERFLAGEIPSDEIFLAGPEEVRAVIDFSIAVLDGQTGSRKRTCSEAGLDPESAPAGTADMPMDLVAADNDAPVQQQEHRPQKRRQGAKNPRARQAARSVALPIEPVLDAIELAFRGQKWGRWHPKRMSEHFYVLEEREPFDRHNERDVYDYMQAVIASSTQAWIGKRAGPSRQALNWLDLGWALIYRSLRAQQDKIPHLPLHLRNGLWMCWGRVERQTLLGGAEGARFIEDLDAEINIGRAMAAKVELDKMPPINRMPAPDDVQVVREVIDLTGV